MLINAHSKYFVDTVCSDIVLLFISVPSQAPKSFTATSGSSTSVPVSWQLPPPYSRNGFITGFKLFYRRKLPAACSPPMTTLIINDGANITKNVTGLLKYTEYEFSGFALHFCWWRTNSSVIVDRTKEDGKKGENCDSKTYLTWIQTISVFISPFDIRVRG